MRGESICICISRSTFLSPSHARQFLVLRSQIPSELCSRISASPSWIKGHKSIDTQDSKVSIMLNKKYLTCTLGAYNPIASPILAVNSTSMLLSRALFSKIIIASRGGWVRYLCGDIFSIYLGGTRSPLATVELFRALRLDFGEKIFSKMSGVAQLPPQIRLFKTVVSVYFTN